MEGVEWGRGLFRGKVDWREVLGDLVMGGGVIFVFIGIVWEVGLTSSGSDGRCSPRRAEAARSNSVLAYSGEVWGVSVITWMRSGDSWRIWSCFGVLGDGGGEGKEEDDSDGVCESGGLCESGGVCEGGGVCECGGEVDRGEFVGGCWGEIMGGGKSSRNFICGDRRFSMHSEHSHRGKFNSFA